MCIGWPMQVVAAQPGRAMVQRRGVPTTRREVGTALVGTVQPGDWLLVFLDDARERLDPARAAEIDATLALVEAALGGPVPLGALPHDGLPPGASAADPFELPSALSVEQLQAFR